MSNRVYIFDTTLRDGEQSPGCSMSVPEKLRMAKHLVELGVDILEAAVATTVPRHDGPARTIRNHGENVLTVHGGGNRGAWGHPLGER